MTNSVNSQTIPLTFSQVLKRIFLGKPLTTAKLKTEKLSAAKGLGAVAPDPISSSNYGTEQILIQLLPSAGMAAFVLVFPVMGILLVVLALVAASYRQVVMAYPQAGGSYVVARENFGPKWAQIAGAALLIDYVVTVAVQTSAGTVAVVSAVRALAPFKLVISVAVVLLVLCYMNLRGVTQAAWPFTVATYSFVVLTSVTIVVGVVRQFFGGVHTYDPLHTPGAVPIHHGSGLVMGATILIVLRAFANGGSSLTGVEAISNAVNVFRDPQGPTARRTVTAMAAILAFLLAGVTYMAYATKAPPYSNGYPSVLSQITQAVFGQGTFGTVMFILVQASSAAVLYTGANGSFNGFPALASFVAEDRFLPGPLFRRGHRLVFSNGIIVLTVLSVALIVVTGGSVDALVPLYAIGVFTGFSMSGYGMTKHHLTKRESGWRRKLVINLSAGIMSTIVVVIFLVAKFTEGAWLIAVIFPVLVFFLMRLNGEYRAEAAILKDSTESSAERADDAAEMRHQVFVCINKVDLATFKAVHYAKGLRADALVAVHFLIDAEHAQDVRKRWDQFDLDVPLRVIDCPDRQLTRAVQTLIAKTREEHPDTNVTVLLPRRAYGAMFGRLLHGRTGEKIAMSVSRTPNAAATIVPYDVQSRISEAYPRKMEQRVARGLAGLESRIYRGEKQKVASYRHPERSSAVTAVAKVIPGRSATVEGRVSEVEDCADAGRVVRSVVVGDDTGDVRVTFGPEHGGSDIQPGQRLRISGRAQRNDGGPVSMADPEYEVIEQQPQQSA